MELVGRHEELTQLKGLFADSSAGAGHVVLVDGGPGVGKTRLIQAFCDYVVESGALLLTATGSRAERTLRMGVVDQLFQGAALAPEFSERVSRLVTVDCQPEIDPDPVTISQADVGSVHALCAVLLELSRQRPVVVAIDDLHFVDGVTLQVLLYLRRRLRSARILLVLGEWAQPRLTRPLFRAELARQPHHRITLGPLSRDGVAELLAQHLDASTATRLAPAVYLLSGGNPLLVHALVDDYRSERRTQTGTDARQPVAGAAFGEAVLTCLLRWGSELLTVARGLATLGRSATPALVGRLVGVTPDVAAEVFDVLSAAGLLESECFEQPEAVAAVLNGLSADDRSRLHARAAKLLLAQGAAASAVARQIIAAGGVAEQWAVGLLRKTADQALANDEVETALTSLELAMGAGAGEQELVEIRAVLARAEWRVNPSAAARHVYPLHRAIGDGLLAGPDGAVVVRHLLWQGDGEGAAKALHLLIGEAGPAGDQTAAELRLAYHWMYGRLPRPATRENGARARVASRLTATSASPWARAADGLSSMFTSAAGNEVASSAEYILQRRLSDTTLEAVAVALFALCYADKPSQAAFWCDALLGEAARRRATTWQAVLRSVRADIAFRQGDLAAAEAQASTALGLLHADSWGVVIGYPLSTLLLTNVAMGRREPADELAKRVVPDAMLHTLFGLRYLHACGHHHLASGRLLAAFSDFERCGTMMRQSDLDVPALVPWRSDLALTQLRLGRPKAPRDLVCEQLGRPGGATGGRVRGISLRVLAATSELRQRPALLREAIDLLQVAGDRLELARALADLSQAHDELGEYGRARAIAGRAAHEAKACQAEALSARLSRHRLAETLSKTSDEQADDLPALSDAERRVATLAAFGHTNREIGRKLYITVSTVEQHLTRVYRKLKVNGRSGLPACLSQYRGTTDAGRERHQATGPEQRPGAQSSLTDPTERMRATSMASSTPGNRPFRFGVTLLGSASRREWVDKCRKAEDLGYDVIAVPDHLGMLAPFPAVVLAAEATRHVRLTTCVLNAGFYAPALLARDVAGVDQFTDGRLEVGLGTGYVKTEFEAAGLAWPSPDERVDHLKRTVHELRRLLTHPDYEPSPVQRPTPPLLIGARGDRTVRLAVQHADIIGFTGTAPAPEGATPTMDDSAAVGERVTFVRNLLGDRASGVELNFLVAKVIVSNNRRALAQEGELDRPSLLIGTAAQMAEDLRARRDQFGFGYITVLESDMTAFAGVIPMLR